MEEGHQYYLAQVLNVKTTKLKRFQNLQGLLSFYIRLNWRTKRCSPPQGALKRSAFTLLDDEMRFTILGEFHAMSGLRNPYSSSLSWESSLFALQKRESICFYGEIKEVWGHDFKHYSKHYFLLSKKQKRDEKVFESKEK